MIAEAKPFLFNGSVKISGSEYSKSERGVRIFNNNPVALKRMIQAHDDMEAEQHTPALIAGDGYLLVRNSAIKITLKCLKGMSAPQNFIEVFERDINLLQGNFSALEPASPSKA